MWYSTVSNNKELYVFESKVLQRIFEVRWSDKVNKNDRGATHRWTCETIVMEMARSHLQKEILRETLGSCTEEKEKNGGQNRLGCTQWGVRLWEILEWFRVISTGKMVVAWIHWGPIHPSSCYKNWLTDLLSAYIADNIWAKQFGCI